VRQKDFFLSPRRRSGERIEERGGLNRKRTSSPPSGGGEEVHSVEASPRCVPYDLEVICLKCLAKDHHAGTRRLAIWPRIYADG